MITKQVKITFKPEPTGVTPEGEQLFHNRPPKYTTHEGAIMTEKILGKFIKDKQIVFINDLGKEVNEDGSEIVFKPNIVIKTPPEPTDKDLIKAMFKKGKKPEMIAEALDVKIEEVKKVLNIKK